MIKNSMRKPGCLKIRTIEMAAAFARMNQFVDALTIVGECGLHSLLQAAAEWGPHIEHIQPGLLLHVLCGMTSAAGWVHPKWREIDELISRVKEGR